MRAFTYAMILVLAGTLALTVVGSADVLMRF